MKDFLELVESRESCRDFNPKRGVELEKLAKIMDAALLSPSACNSQPWHFTVVGCKEKADQLKTAIQKFSFNKFVQDCPAFIVINEENANLSAKLGGKLQDQHYAENDIGIAAAHIVLCARDLGLSTCILGMFDEGRVKEVCGIAKNKRVRLIVAIGYARTSALRQKKRKNREEVITFLCDDIEYWR